MAELNEYIVTLDEETARKLTELSQDQGIDNDLTYLEIMVKNIINEAYAMKKKDYPH